MYQRIIILLAIVISLVTPSVAQAAICATDADCDPPKGIYCKPDPTDPTLPSFCQRDEFRGNFGNIKPPDALKGLMKDQTGATGISEFLSNLIVLFYSIAGIVLIFMLIWGAFEWLISGGEKEKVHSAQQRIIHAIIGIVLFAIAFAVIRVIGAFTGFKFFV